MRLLIMCLATVVLQSQASAQVANQCIPLSKRAVEIEKDLSKWIQASGAGNAYEKMRGPSQVTALSSEANQITSLMISIGCKNIIPIRGDAFMKAAQNCSYKKQVGAEGDACDKAKWERDPE